MGGVFAEWQPRYAEHAVATFPVRAKEKKPAIKGYLKLGLQSSGQLAIKFPEAESFGFACRRNKITVLDVDAPDERLLADALDELGPTPLIVRSHSGNFQAWYRNNNEGRRIRPDPSRPIDILGDGYVVAPPSQGARGLYSLIQGRLDDLGALPIMRRSSALLGGSTASDSQQQLQAGNRNNELWRACMKQAVACRTFDELLEAGMQMNLSQCYEPLPADEVLRIVASAWEKERTGENWFGRGGRVTMQAEDIDGILSDYPDAFILLTLLRRYHWGKREFVVANAMHSSMPGGGWREKRFTAARKRLEEAGEIVMVRPHSKHSPALYRFKGGQK